MKELNIIKEVTDNFKIYGDFVDAKPYGSGHINDTFAVDMSQSGTDIRYIYQRINTDIFTEPEKLMDNIYRVCRHLNEKLANSAEKSRQTLTLIDSVDDKPYYIDSEGRYWRVYIFVEKAKTYDIIETEDQAFQAASSFGKFQCELADIEGDRLSETIPNFHNTPSRYEALELAIAEDKAGRAASCQKEIDFILSRKSDASLLINLMKEGKIPERITHNDTKLNNVMIDDETGKGICVIDLDTAMPGLVHYDFGDLVRTSTSPAAEDETDLSKVKMQFNMFEALLRGYLSTAGEFLTDTEREYLPFAGKLITLETGVRFLTDYLNGDTYFKIHRENHNLDRCRTQIALVESIEEQTPQMVELLNSI